MKKFALFALCLLIFSGCKKEPQSQPDPNIQDYTSFIFWHNAHNTTMPNCVIGYYTSDGLCHKLAELGDLKPNIKSQEITVVENIPEIFFFTDYNGVVKAYESFKLRRNYKNIFLIGPESRGIHVDKNNPKEYPH